MSYHAHGHYISHDEIQTPPELAQRLVKHFAPKGRILEPCKGSGHFLKFLPCAEWCEINEGIDFYDWDQRVDWIITSPPWSQVRTFLNHAMTVAEHVVFLMPLDHLWTRARIQDIHASGFGIKEIALVEMPKTFPQTDSQLGAIYVRRGWLGHVKVTDLSDEMDGISSPGLILKRSSRVALGGKRCSPSETTSKLNHS